MIAPSARLHYGHKGTKEKTASRAARHDDKQPGPARHPFTAARPKIPSGWTTRPASATLEPVTAPAGVRAAHLSPPARPVTTRSHHATQFRGNPAPPRPRDCTGTAAGGRTSQAPTREAARTP